MNLGGGLSPAHRECDLNQEKATVFEEKNPVARVRKENQKSNTLPWSRINKNGAAGWMRGNYTRVV